MGNIFELIAEECYYYDKWLEEKELAEQNRKSKESENEKWKE